MVKILDTVPVSIVVFLDQPVYQVVYVNQAFQKNTGQDSSQWVGQGLREQLKIYQGDRGVVAHALKQARRIGDSDEYEFRLLDQRDQYQWYMFRVQSRELREGPGFLMALWNIHERKLMEQELYVQMERYKLVELVTDDISFDYNVASKEILVPAKYLHMCGRDQELEHFASVKELRELIGPESLDGFSRMLDLASQREHSGSLEFRLKVGKVDSPKYVWYRLNYKSLPDMQGNIIRIVGRMRNIHAEKQERLRLADRAKRDAMTGLLNKMAIQEEVEACLARSSHEIHAMMVVDIDNFKDVNDNFGHLFGDTVLIGIAEKIKSIFRPTDLVGRVGGDEFLVFMKQVSEAQVQESAKALCQGLEMEIPGRQITVKIGCSVGISLFDRDGSDWTSLFGQADCAMYLAKKQGKNQYQIAVAGCEMSGLRSVRDTGDELVRAGTAQDKNFLLSAFSLLSHAKDLDSSLKLLLERVGIRYDLDTTAILEEPENLQENDYEITHCWRKGSGGRRDFSSGKLLNEWKQYVRERGDREIECLMDCLDPQGSDNQLGAMITCRFVCGDGRRGVVGFGCVGRTRQWGGFEQETFQEIAHIISVFVSLRHSQKESEAVIQTLQHQDPVTGLYNEAGFKGLAQEILNHPNPNYIYAVAFADINDFSYVNENFGLEAGNEILREYGVLVSGENVISCRLYSDLFISLIWIEGKDMMLSAIDAKAQEFVQQQQAKYPQSNLRLVAGIYFVEQPGEDIEVAIENANLTRKRIKKNTEGMLYQVYTPDLRRKREQEKRVIADFMEALKRGQFQIYIQPKFLLRTLEMNGGEALVRWLKPDGTIVPPGEFISILEKFGYIVELDFFVYEQVLKLLKRWKQQGRKLYRISVNFSRRHFEGQGIYEMVKKLAKQYEVDPRYIEVEITESLLVAGLDMVRREMHQLRQDGFYVSIDDFGTGYSSLSMLQDMPADIVKIDRSFLNKDNMESGGDFIRRIGDLISSIKEEVIFEGVETKEQLDFLVDSGFLYGQGFYYDRPLPVSVFEEKYLKD